MKLNEVKAPKQFVPPLTLEQYANLKKYYFSGKGIEKIPGLGSFQDKLVTGDSKIWSLLKGIDSAKELIKMNAEFKPMSDPMIKKAETQLAAILDERIAYFNDK